MSLAFSADDVPQASPVPSVSVALYTTAGCASSDPPTGLPIDNFTDDVCHSPSGCFRSGVFSLEFEGAIQGLRFFADPVCNHQTLQVSNDGTANGQCYIAEGDGWQGMIYITYR